MLRNFCEGDIPNLQKNGYGDMDDQALRDLIEEWNRKTHKDRYFEAFAVHADEELVGIVSLYQITGFAVSVGMEIFTAHLRKGHAVRAVNEALKIAKEKGYTLAMDQVRTDNEASIALHKKLGFETDGYEYQNRRGQPVCLWLKPL